MTETLVVVVGSIVLIVIAVGIVVEGISAWREDRRRERERDPTRRRLR